MKEVYTPSTRGLFSYPQTHSPFDALCTLVTKEMARAHEDVGTAVNNPNVLTPVTVVSYPSVIPSKVYVKQSMYNYCGVYDPLAAADSFGYST